MPVSSNFESSSLGTQWAPPRHHQLSDSCEALRPDKLLCIFLPYGTAKSKMCETHDAQKGGMRVACGGLLAGGGW